MHAETKTSWSEEVGGASGAERAFSATLALLLGRTENRGADYAGVAPSEATTFFAELSRFGNGRPGSHLGDGVPGYSLYAARDGWISVPEQYFWERLLLEFGLEEASREDFEKVLYAENGRRVGDPGSRERPSGRRAPGRAPGAT